MTTYHIDNYHIRVILNTDYYTNATKSEPHDVEGSILQIRTQCKRSSILAMKGQFIDVLCNTHNEVFGDAYVRWDNDVKVWLPFNSFILRSSKIHRCESIWNKDTVLIDNRPYTELKPNTTSESFEVLLKNFDASPRYVKDNLSNTWGLLTSIEAPQGGTIANGTISSRTVSKPIEVPSDSIVERTDFYKRHKGPYSEIRDIPLKEKLIRNRTKRNERNLRGRPDYVENKRKRTKQEHFSRNIKRPYNQQGVRIKEFIIGYDVNSMGKKRASISEEQLMKVFNDNIIINDDIYEDENIDKSPIDSNKKSTPEHYEIRKPTIEKPSVYNSIKRTDKHPEIKKKNYKEKLKKK